MSAVARLFDICGLSAVGPKSDLILNGKAPHYRVELRATPLCIMLDAGNILEFLSRC